MKNHNYLEKLTAQQLQKWKEKKGAIYYYEWYDHLVNSVDLECAGAVLLAVLYYDRNLFAYVVKIFLLLFYSLFQFIISCDVILGQEIKSFSSLLKVVDFSPMLITFALLRFDTVLNIYNQTYAFSFYLSGDPFL